MAFPQIKDVTLLAVIEKAMQNDPVEYCGRFLSENEQTADTLASLAVELARSWYEADDTAEIVAHSTVLSAVMFMTYEMARAEVEARELEELIG
jgi:proteasome lid subunit RPN8/RPN11